MRRSKSANRGSERRLSNLGSTLRNIIQIDRFIVEARAKPVLRQGISDNLQLLSLLYLLARVVEEEHFFQEAQF
jgi:hypothetical protein